eukprot:6455727-Amphidinium_carterae.1
MPVRPKLQPQLRPSGSTPEVLVHGQYGNQACVEATSVLNEICKPTQRSRSFSELSHHDVRLRSPIVRPTAMLPPQQHPVVHRGSLGVSTSLDAVPSAAPHLGQSTSKPDHAALAARFAKLVERTLDGISPRKEAVKPSTQGKPEQKKPAEPTPVTVTVRHARHASEVEVTVPRGATLAAVREEVARKLKRPEVQTQACFKKPSLPPVSSTPIGPKIIAAVEERRVNNRNTSSLCSWRGSSLRSAGRDWDFAGALFLEACFVERGTQGTDCFQSVSLLE